MAKILKIQGVIEPAMIESLAAQIEDQNIETGDDVDILYDSQGGVVDVAFAIDDVFEQMQEAGINMRSVAEGKVFSSAIIPFLSVDNRVALKGSSFLVHKATYENLTNVDKDRLRELQQQLEEYTDILCDFYEDHGITREVRTHLKQGDDLTIEKPKDMIEAGFVSKIVNERPRIYNRILRGIDRFFPSSPNFSYIYNIQQIQDKIMTSKQIEQLLDKKLADAIPQIAAGVAAVIKNELDPATEDEPRNNTEAVTAEELSKLEGSIFKTPIVIDGQDEAAFVMHFGNDLSAANAGQILNSEGSLVTLPDGDYAIKVGEDEMPFNVVNGFGKFGTVTNDTTTPAEEPEETQVPEVENAEEPAEETPVVENKVAPKPTTSAAPKPVQKVPVANKNSHAKQMHEMFAGYGAGCVGSK